MPDFKKAKKAPVKKSTTAENAVYLYLCECHGVPATKPSCIKVDKKSAETQTLGSWRCSMTQKPTKVKRVNKPAKE